MGMQLSVLQQKLAEVNHPVAEQPDSVLPARDLNWNLPSNWTNFSILCEPIFVTQRETLKHLFCICGYCAPNFELNDQLLAEAIRIDPSSCQELLNELESFGLLERSPRGLVITNQMADFARWIGSLEQFDLLQDLIDAWDQLLCSPQCDDKILNHYPNLAHLKTVLIYAITAGIQKRGFILYFLGRYYQRKKALPLAKFFMEKAFELDRAEYGFEHIKVGVILNILGNLAAQQGMPGEAAACYIKALNIYKKNLDPDHPFILTAQASLEQLGSDYDW
jgi:tetratricopeptide (TPR) repeat protein